MSVEMNKQRLKELIQAYGHDASKWPVKDRELASWLTEHQQDEYLQQLDEATDIDAYLKLLPRQMPGAGLTETILAGYSLQTKWGKFSFGLVLKLLLGESPKMPAMALASILGLLIVGGAGGYAGAGLMMEPEPSIAILSQAFENGDFLSEVEFES